MRPAWRRVVNHFFPPARADNEADHRQKINEARCALEAAKRDLTRINELGNQVDTTATRAKNLRNRNHFSELVAEMLREGR